jgi:peptidoglycan/LPS O-acetylase OafA/YrhL
MICRGCAHGGKNKLHQVSPGSFALAAVACLAASLFGGWFIASQALGYGFMGLWAGFFFGLGIGEIALRVTGRKRGTAMEILAGASVVLGIVGGMGINLLLHPETANLFFHLTNPLTWAMLVLATVSAVGRIRNI